MEPSSFAPLAPWLRAASIRLCRRGVRVVPHVQQSYSWDCGLACTEMILRALGVPAAECSLPQLRCKLTAPNLTSVWTVDLAYVLHSYGLRFRFLTTTLGADPAYAAESFYKETLDADTVRVNELFSGAEKDGVSIERHSMPAADLEALVKPQDHLVMALVDRRHLYRPSPSSVSGVIDACMSYVFSGYVGHYVLLTRYDAERDGYLILDPAKQAEEGIFVTSQNLHAARRSHGTDEDLVVVPLQQSRGFLQQHGLTASATPFSEAKASPAA
jgi:hypothetical protein